MESQYLPDMEVDFNPRYKPCGLVNNGDSCWLNSVIQAIFGCTYLRNNILYEWSQISNEIIKRFKQEKEKDLLALNCIECTYRGASISFGDLANENPPEAYRNLPTMKNFPEGNLYTETILILFINTLIQLDNSVGGKISIYSFFNEITELYTKEYPRIPEKFNFKDGPGGNDESCFLDYIMGLIKYAFKNIDIPTFILEQTRGNNYYLLSQENVDTLDQNKIYELPLIKNYLVGKTFDIDVNNIDILILRAPMYTSGRYLFIKPHKRYEFFGSLYLLQTIIIKRGGHFITITTEGRYNDTLVYYGRRYFDFFCEYGYDIDLYDSGSPEPRAGSFYFYEKVESLNHILPPTWITSKEELDKPSPYHLEIDIWITINKFWKRPVFSETNKKSTRLREFTNPYFSFLNIDIFPSFKEILLEEREFIKKINIEMEKIFSSDGKNALKFMDTFSLKIDHRWREKFLLLKNIILKFMNEDVLLYGEVSENFLENLGDFQSLLPRTRLQILLDESNITEDRRKKEYIIRLLQVTNPKEIQKIITDFVTYESVKKTLSLLIAFWMGPTKADTGSAAAVELRDTGPDAEELRDTGRAAAVERRDTGRAAEPHSAPVEKNQSGYYTIFDHNTLGNIILMLVINSIKQNIIAFKKYGFDKKIDKKDLDASCGDFIKGNKELITYMNKIYETYLKSGRSLERSGDRMPIHAELRLESAGAAAVSRTSPDIHTDWLNINEFSESYYNLYKDEIQNKEIFRMPMSEFIEQFKNVQDSKSGDLARQLMTLSHGGYSHSKQQKYLKYKNKYLQLKRMEKN